MEGWLKLEWNWVTQQDNDAKQKQQKMYNDLAEALQRAQSKLRPQTY